MPRRKLPRVTRAITKAEAARTLADLRSLRYLIRRWKRIDEKQRALLLAWSDHAIGAIDQLLVLVQAVHKNTVPRSPWLKSPTPSTEPEAIDP